jgi:hypothetical protein
MANVVGTVSLALALAAVVVAVWQVRKSANLTEKTNALPVVAAIFNEARSAEFRSHVNRLLTEDPHAGPSDGFDALPEAWRESAYAVAYYYDYLGALAANRLIDERIIIGVTSTRLMQVWAAIFPFIVNERRYRELTYPTNASPGFLRYYEHLVARTIEMGGREAPSAVQRAIGLKSLSG